MSVGKRYQAALLSRRQFAAAAELAPKVRQSFDPKEEEVVMSRCVGLGGTRGRSW